MNNCSGFVSRSAVELIKQRDGNPMAEKYLGDPKFNRAWQEFLISTKPSAPLKKNLMITVDEIKRIDFKINIKNGRAVASTDEMHEINIKKKKNHKFVIAVNLRE